MTHDLKLFIAHTACSRVTMTALEKVGAPYAAHMIDFRTGENRKPDYLALNPQGKVPCLLVDGEPLTENLAIMRWLHAEYPDAGLFPVTSGAMEEARQLAVLGWISSVWHPSVRAIKVPMMWTTGETEPVKARGSQLFTALLDQLDRELAQRRWWFGNDWSIVDTYFWWAYTNSEFGGFDLGPWMNVSRHRADNEALPQLRQALAREEQELGAMKARRI